MTREEIDILFSAPVREAIAANIAGDPVKIALDKRIVHAGRVATQVKYLQRARTKLPSFYEARCVIPPLAFEQASSERTAAQKTYSGGLCIDLTCGLGVDTLALSQRFTRVIALERDPALAYLAQRNFELLGAGNITVINCPAEEYLASPDAPRADLIYADPDRRSMSGRKLVCLEDCEPDIVALLPRLRELAGKVVVKMSPLFDVDEVFRIFGSHSRAEVVSLDGECKEVLAETGGGIPTPRIAATVTGFGTVEYDARQPEIPALAHAPENLRYLVVPDVALAKARIAKRYFTESGLYIETDNSYAFADTLPDALPGKAYRIAHSEPYAPKKLKKMLADSGIKRADILKHDFPVSAADIARQLGVKEGGGTKIAFTRMGGQLLALFIEPV